MSGEELVVLLLVFFLFIPIVIFPLCGAMGLNSFSNFEGLIQCAQFVICFLKLILRV